jgi:uncharacterized protein (TIGR02996 family)
MNDETPFIEAILAAPEDEAPRLIYADWLEERGDVRGEYLRLEAALGSLPEGDHHRRTLTERLNELRPTIDAEWLALVDRSRIEGCVTFAFQCPARWESLTRTDDSLVRFCERCRKKVFYAASLKQARRHAAFGHCIAVNSTLVRKEGDVRIDPTRDPQSFGLVLGVPAPPAPRYAVGDHVRVLRGPHKGRIGEIAGLRLSYLRAAVEVEQSGKRVSVEMPFEEIERVRQQPRGLRRPQAL